METSVHTGDKCQASRENEIMGERKSGAIKGIDAELSARVDRMQFWTSRRQLLKQPAHDYTFLSLGLCSSIHHGCQQ